MKQHQVRNLGELSLVSFQLMSIPLILIIFCADIGQNGLSIVSFDNIISIRYIGCRKSRRQIIEQPVFADFVSFSFSKLLGQILSFEITLNFCQFNGRV